MKIFKRILIVVIILAAVIGIWLLKTVRDAGEFKTLKPHSSCTCQKIEGVPGPEDLAVDHETGITYISSFDRWAWKAGELKQGAIHGYKIKADKGELRNLTADLEMEFYPHGLSLFDDPAGGKLLFVINHRKDGHSVEIFAVNGMSLAHKETVTGDLMISPNDVAAVGPRQFYFSNDHGATSGLSRTLEDYLQQKKANLVYYNGKSFSIVVEDIAYANGVAVTGDGETLFLASTIGKKLRVFRRDIKSGSLELAQTIDIGTAGDNIDIDNRGRILLTCHPKLLTFVKHSNDSTKKSPSQILEVKEEGGKYKAEEIYLNMGDDISGASVAAPFGNRLLVGAVFERYFLDCSCE
jgi:arylesterase/paraoxonase